jgi:transcription initiation factor TFIID TATA-box-binding protein
MKDPSTIIIQNIVATSTIATRLDLINVLKALDEGATYEPETFPGLVYHLKDPKTATLIFSSGKLVCTGAKSIAKAHQAIGTVLDRLAGAGFEVDKRPVIVVQNIVATSDLHMNLNLNNLALTLGLDNVEYEPEQFPGLVYRIADPKVVVLIFSSGKIVLTGAKTEDDLALALKKIQTELQDDGLL